MIMPLAQHNELLFNCEYVIHSQIPPPYYIREGDKGGG
jgi:hypothetical protein